MRRPRLSSTRGQLVLWYLSAVAVLLLALGIFQSLIVASYLRSSTADSMRHAAHAQLAQLGRCFILSSADLVDNSQTLAQLLGSHDTAVKIVTTRGVALADRGFGPPGASRPLRLSVSTIRALIRSDTQSQAARRGRPDQCQPSAVNEGGRGQVGAPGPPPRAPTTIESGGLLLEALPLGPPDHVVGYAILGQSLGPIDATVRDVRLVFGLGAAIALVIAALVALPIINHALRPLGRVADTAEAIAAGDQEKRANLTRSPDEVGRLGKAFDSMVDRLHEAISAATASEERMRTFLADASHELRTPLTVLRATSQVLLRQRVSERADVVASLEAMHEESTRLSRLVDDLLTLSRLDAGQQLEPRPVALERFLEEFVERYALAWPERRVQVSAATLDGGTAYIDPDALTRVLTNLIDNAARYSRPGTPITIAATEQAGEIEIQVRDEGPGLRQEEAERVFERFYRVGKSRSRRSGGTGLGLAIVDALVEQSGGGVHIDTGPERGTTVIVTLPRKSDQSG